MDTSEYVDTYYGYNAASSSLVGGTFVFAVIMWIISIIIGVVCIVSLWRIFKKAGKPGWASLIPFYNYYVMCEIAEKQWWYVLLLFVPIAQLYSLFVVYDGVNKKFGKSTGFSVGMFFLPFVFLPILAFSNANVISESNNGLSDNAVPQAQQNESQPITAYNVNNSYGNMETNTLNQNQVNNMQDSVTDASANQEPNVNNAQGYATPTFEQSSNTNVQEPVMAAPTSQEPNVNNAQGYVAPAFEQPSNMNVQEPVMAAPISQEPNVNNDQGYVAPAFEQPSNMNVQEPVMTAQTNQEPNVNNAQGYTAPAFDQSSNMTVQEPVMTAQTNQEPNVSNAQGYASPMFEQSSYINVQEPVMSAPTSQEPNVSNAQGYASPTFEQSSNVNVQEPVMNDVSDENLSQKLETNSSSSAQPQQNNIQDDSATTISNNEKHTSFWANRNNQ